MTEQQRLLLSDIDGTVTQNPPILSRMAGIQAQNGTLREGYLDGLRGVSERYHASKGAMSYADYVNGLLTLYAEGLRGVELATVLSQTRDAIASGIIPLHSNVMRIIEACQSVTHDVVFVTASPQFIGEAVSELFTPAECISSVFEADGNVLTGRVTSSLAAEEAKLDAIQGRLARYPKRGSIAIGDAVGDRRMLEQVQFGIAVNPDDLLRQAARERGYRIMRGIV